MVFKIRTLALNTGEGVPQKRLSCLRFSGLSVVLGFSAFLGFSVISGVVGLGFMAHVRAMRGFETDRWILAEEIPLLHLQ